MFCNQCGEKLKTLDTRISVDNTVMRRRHCSKCNLRYFTVETLLEVEKHQSVVKQRKFAKEVKQKIEPEKFNWLGVKL